MNTFSPTLQADAATIDAPALPSSAVFHKGLRLKGDADEIFQDGQLSVRATRRASFTEYHLTATVTGPAAATVAAADLLERVAAALAIRHIQPIQEKFYGLAPVRSLVLDRRASAWRRYGLEASIPYTWIQGPPLLGCDFVGLQVWGIAPHDGSERVTTVDNPATGRGRLWTGDGFRLLYQPFVRGTKAGGALPDCRAAQIEQMFTNAGVALKTQDMAYRHVARTWIYMSRLLDGYDDLNRVRTAHYRPAGLGVQGGVPFPASTGIQGRYDNEECMMDVLALDAETPAHAAAIAINRSPRQDSSFNYGSAFSRGMAIAIEGRRTIHISGTASINTAGESTHLGDAEAQSLETLLSIAAILEEQGGSLKNITSATLFCKDRSAWEAWQRVTRLLQITSFPKVAVIADVCRSNLLVEMEAVATI